MLIMRTGIQPAELEDLIALLHDAEEDDGRTRAALTNRAYQTYTGWVDDQLIGAAVVDWRPGLDSEILYIGVDRDHRGSGYGRQILEHIIAELPRHGQRLIVGTANSSLDNIAFYQRCGFRMHAVKRDYFAYLDPAVTEFDIVLRDMIVFSYERTGQQRDERAEAEEVDLHAVDAARFLLIPGSMRSASRNNTVLRTARSLAPRSVLFDGLLKLPQFNPDDDPDNSRAVSELRSMVAEADVVLFCTPEYAGALPGSLKNLIDWTVGTGEFYQKPVAWINVAAAGRGAGASQELSRVLGYVDAQVLEPGGLQLPLDSASIGPDHELSEDYRERLRRGLVRLAGTYQRQKVARGGAG